MPGSEILSAVVVFLFVLVTWNYVSSGCKSLRKSAEVTARRLACGCVGSCKCKTAGGAAAIVAVAEEGASSGKTDGFVGSGVSKENSNMDPSQDRHDAMNAAGDYQLQIQKMSLEAGVAESHQRYVSELTHVSSGASGQTQISHDIDINPRVGLRRTDYTSAVAEPDARTVHSTHPHQMAGSRKRDGCLI